MHARPARVAGQPRLRSATGAGPAPAAPGPASRSCSTASGLAWWSKSTTSPRRSARCASCSVPRPSRRCRATLPVDGARDAAPVTNGRLRRRAQPARATDALHRARRRPGALVTHARPDVPFHADRYRRLRQDAPGPELTVKTLPSFSDGVRYVDLAAQQDRSASSWLWWAALGVSAEERDAPLIDRLCRHLQPRQCLLVLDNCEHLIAACAALVQRLLVAAPRLTVLAASREGPGRRANACSPYARFVIPRRCSGRSPGTDDALRYESVQLFVERASVCAVVPARSPQRRWRDRDLPPSLTASRWRSSWPPLASTCLGRGDPRAAERSIPAFTGGRHAALGRQQTLRAAIQWSHDHLDNDDRMVLRRLAVFRRLDLKPPWRWPATPGDEYAMPTCCPGWSITARSW